MDSLNIALIQADLIWENPQENRGKFERLFSSLPDKTELIVLPEMFTTGFSMAPEKLAEDMNGVSVNWLLEQANSRKSAITGSLIIKENGHYYNRLIWAMPDGTCHTYDKRHLFTLAGEDKIYQPGKSQLIVSYKGWQIMPLICYDLRFPVWSRNQLNYDLLLFVANFPDKRGLAWRTLLQARAIENQAYTIGLNRVGSDGNGIYHAGDSCLIDYNGQFQAHLPAREMVQHICISKTAQDHFRKRFAFLPDQDQFKIYS